MLPTASPHPKPSGSHSALFTSLPALDTSDLLRPSLTEQDHIEYFAYSAQTLLSHLDWSLHSSSSSHSDSPFLLDYFVTLALIEGKTVHGVDGSSITTHGIGQIKLPLRNGNSLLDHVLYIPSSAVKLLSISRLANAYNCTVSFTSHGVNIFSNNCHIASGSHLKNKNLYSLDLPLSRLAEGMPITLSIPPAKCEHCILGKQKRTPVPLVWQGACEDRKLGLIWVDLAGPEAIPSSNGYLYFMNIVDDCTGFVWTILLKHKSDALSSLQSWALRAQNETGSRLCRL